MVYFAPARFRRSLTVREAPGAYSAAPPAAGAPVLDPADDASVLDPASDASVLDPAADASVCDPFDDADALEELGDEIATLAAHIHAGTQRLLALVAEFDRRRGWELGGHVSCGHWLAYRTGMTLGAAREKVRTARALEHLPETSASMGRGELSFSKVRALSRVATAGNETELLELARGVTTAQLERMVRGWKRGSRGDEVAFERERLEMRRLSVFPDLDGMYVVTGRLTPEVGALLMRAVEAAGDVLYREKSGPWQAGAEVERAAAQHRADALGLLAERALAAGFGERPCSCDRHETPTPTSEEKATPGAALPPRGTAAADAALTAVAAPPGQEIPAAEAALTVDAAPTAHETPAVDALPTADAAPRAREMPSPACGCGAAPISGTRAERYQVLLHVDLDTLAADANPGRSELEDGTRVSAETSRRLSCDAATVQVSVGKGGSVLDVGRRTRTISPALRRALEVRDRGCRFPGCGLRFTDAHHVRHWADGGETSLANCALLCRYHHTLVHEGGWRMEWWGEGRPAFFDPRGRAHFDGRWEPPPGLSERPVDALIEHNRLHGAHPNGDTAGARWKREADVPDRVYFRALEGLD